MKNLSGRMWEVSENMKRIRKEHFESQSDLADVMGTSQIMVSNYEIGKSTPSIDYLLRFCSHYNVPYSKVLG